MGFSYQELFPVCQSERCPLRGKHKHTLESQLELLESSEKYVLSVGGVGSGKTLAAAVLGVLLSLTVPGNLGLVMRRTYALLHDNTQRIYLEVLERARDELGLEWNGRENRDGFPHHILFPGNASEIFFRESKDPGRYRGQEYGWYHVDEASEEPPSTFDGLNQRLRLPRAGAFLKGMLTTNPPHERHWLAQRFGATPGVTQVGRETFRLIRSSTRQNPHLPEGYLDGLLSSLSQAEIRRVVEGEFGFHPEGPAVFPQFHHGQHVGMPAIRAIALVRAWDFGFRHPAVTFSQRWHCGKRQLHWAVLAELDAPQSEGEALAELVLKKTDEIFPDHGAHLLLDCGDAAGAAVSERGPGPIIRLAQPPYNLRFAYRKLPKIEPGLDLMRGFLRAKKCLCGEMMFQVHRRCRGVIDALAGGYHYSEKNSERPVKDGYYDDFVDSLRYAAEIHIRPELEPEETSSILTPPVRSDQWRWMRPDLTERELLAEHARVKERML